ncbi:MAG: hypothetical protein B6D55_07995 [Candidatus Omnitrophica bacterium 4484_70.2]|nr:MAG: hypothetical protein B6D55_07995 [Candidatus Omnitrophica bacterium 4484_70.2]
MKLLYRKVYRLFSFFFILLYNCTPKTITLLVVGFFIFLILILEYWRFKNPHFNEKIFKLFSSYLKEKEKRKISSTTIFFFVIFFIVLLFSKDVALISLCFLIFPDIFSALGGSFLGRIKIIQDKTLEGSLCFFSCCIIIGFIFKKLGFDFSWKAIFTSSFLASMVELIPYIDDNISVPFTAAIIFEILRL